MLTTMLNLWILRAATVSPLHCPSLCVHLDPTPCEVDARAWVSCQRKPETLRHCKLQNMNIAAYEVGHLLKNKFHTSTDTSTTQKSDPKWSERITLVAILSSNSVDIMLLQHALAKANRESKGRTEEVGKLNQPIRLKSVRTGPPLLPMHLVQNQKLIPWQNWNT